MAWGAGKGCELLGALVSQPSGNENTKDPFGERPYEKHFELRLTDRPAGGTQGGVWFRDADGQFFFGKNYDGNEARLIAEHLTDEIYEEMGVKVPKTYLRRLTGKPYLLSEEVEGKTGSTPKALAQSDVGEDFVIDAWLANWDVIGEGYDNVLIKDHHAYRVDNGGALFWRAQGEKKPFGREVKELEIMRRNFQAGDVFGKLSDAQVAGQIRRFLMRYAKRRGAIRQIVKESGLPSAQRTRILSALDARAAWLTEVALPKLHQAALARTDAQRAASDELHAILGDEIWRSELAEVREGLPAKAAKLTDGELIALKEYTGGDFMEINQALRGTGEGFEDWLKPSDQGRYYRETYMPYIELAESALKKLPDFRGTVTRLVELSPRQIARYRLGATVEEVGFTSTTHKGNTPYPGNVRFEIVSKHGKKIAFINSDEDEVLFPPGASFKVASKRFNREESTWHIKLVEK